LALQLPARIGKYELEERLGGGMSDVYRARDTVLGRTVVVKVLTDAGCNDPDAKARFLQEARLSGNIEHDNVISIYDFGEDERQHPFMVMEFLRGEDLRHAIREGHLGDLPAKLRIALQVARALGYIHSLDIVHRDIKPENIHLTTSGAVKLMDFGIAKTQGLSMTRTGYVMGTPYYMAPEQVMGKNIGPAVDIYAFGVLFCELLAGVRPVSGDTVERIFYAILNEPLDLAPLRGSVPPPVCDLIARCTAKDPAQRPPSFAAVAAEIEGILTAAETPTRVATPQAQAVAALPTATAGIAKPIAKPFVKAWMAVVLGIALLIAIAVLVTLLLAPGHRTETQQQAKQPPVAPMATMPATLNMRGGDMVLVQAGPFLYGKDKVRVPWLPAFYIDRTEVSNAAYKMFCDETGYPLPANFKADAPDLPVVNVTIADARKFAQWAHKRLPTSQEWEKAARGDQGRLFPWGDTKLPENANVKDNPNQEKHEIMQVDSFQQGKSRYGALDMVGNVWEFIDEEIEPDAVNAKRWAKKLDPPLRPQEHWYKIRGESFSDNLQEEAASDDSAVPLRGKGSNIGFRCAMNPPQAH
jgi:serine/threonine-protein kinase